MSAAWQNPEIDKDTSNLVIPSVVLVFFKFVWSADIGNETNFTTATLATEPMIVNHYVSNDL